MALLDAVEMQWKSSTHGNIRKADENQRKQLKELWGYYVKISA